MQPIPEHHKELEAFPPPLRALVEAELAAGNSLVELGHGFPAAPVGAYALLARKVTTRRRDSGDGLDFYERNTPRYSGEFTDARRHFFVLEPPNPPPAEPDMDAIRRSLEKPPESPDRPAPRRSARARNAPKPDKPPTAKPRPRKARKPETKPTPEPGPGPRLPPGAVLQGSTPTGVAWLLHFQDRRPPHEVAQCLEGRLMALLDARVESERLVYRATVSRTNATYAFELAFEGTPPRGNAYSLRVEGAWPGQPEAARQHHCFVSGLWFEMWTRGFEQAAPAPRDAADTGRYRELRDAALVAERDLDSVQAVQQAIVAAMKDGATFSTSHKEGGTVVAWSLGKFRSSDYGESTRQATFPDEDSLLGYLRRTYDWQLSRSDPSHPPADPDLTAWKLILRLLRR